MSMTPATVSTLAPSIISAIRASERIVNDARACARYEDRVSRAGDYDDSEGFNFESVEDALYVISGRVDIDIEVWFQTEEFGLMMAVVSEMVKSHIATILEDRARKALETSAIAFARRCKHPVGTREYVLAARKALELAQLVHADQFNSELRMERAAASKACGVTDEDHWSNEDALSEDFYRDINNMSRVLKWLEENCPLLMLKIAEEPAPAE